jgi:hypothetical protein
MSAGVATRMVLLEMCVSEYQHYSPIISIFASYTFVCCGSCQCLLHSIHLSDILTQKLMKLLMLGGNGV